MDFKAFAAHLRAIKPIKLNGWQYHAWLALVLDAVVLFNDGSIARNADGSIKKFNDDPTSESYGLPVGSVFDENRFVSACGVGSAELLRLYIAEAKRGCARCDGE